MPDAWIPVSERLPEDDVDVLVFVDDFVEIAQRSGGYWLNGDAHEWADGSVTHWQPLPPPPEVKG